MPTPLPMPHLAASIAGLIVAMFCAVGAHADSPQAGWTAELSTLAHDVSGTVMVIDDNTLQFDDFTYDGEGLVVYFYLGAAQTQADFTNGLSIGEDLFGTAFDGTQPAFTIDLPANETIEGWNAISVWCVAVDASFGDGTFVPPVLPGDFNADGLVNLADYTTWRDHLGADEGTLLSGNGDNSGTIDSGDYSLWKQSFATAAAAANVPAPVTSTRPIPEPTALASCLACLMGLAVQCRLRLIPGRRAE